jgi:hypothetical protein
MTGEDQPEEELDIVHTGENVTNVVRGRVTGTVMQFDTIGPGDVVGDGIIIRARPAKEEQD